jgi:hypothetical protein
MQSILACAEAALGRSDLRCGLHPGVATQIALSLRGFHFRRAFHKRFAQRIELAANHKPPSLNNFEDSFRKLERYAEYPDNSESGARSFNRE